MPKLPTPRMKKIAQYVLLFEHPDALTAAKEYTGSYWKYH